MPSFLFWNLQGNSGRRTPDRAARLAVSIGRLAMSKRIDVFVFCEFHLDRSDLIEELGRATGRIYHVHKTRSRRIVFVSNLEERRVREVHSEPLMGDRLAVHRLELPGGRDILLAGLHFPDRISIPDPYTREALSRSYAKTLGQVEKDAVIPDLIVVGDFNMNPYETAMLGAGSLHALPDRAMLRSVADMTARRGRPIFYNPCWSLLGDRTPGPTGSHFFRNPGILSNHFWHLYDQVLLRPSLAGCLDEIEILSDDGAESFMSRNGRPSSFRFSDHLPLYFRLTL